MRWCLIGACLRCKVGKEGQNRLRAAVKAETGHAHLVDAAKKLSWAKLCRVIEVAGV